MKEKLLALVLKNINFGKWLPALFKMIAEGKVDTILHLTAPAGIRCYPLKRAYWFMAGKKTITGAIIFGSGWGLSWVCGHYAEFDFACAWSTNLMRAGELLVGIGLIDAGTRAPWPAGTPQDGRQQQAQAQAPQQAQAQA